MCIIVHMYDIDGTNINTMFNIVYDNETLLNMKRMGQEKLDILIDCKFDFGKYVNVPATEQANVHDPPFIKIVSHRDLGVLKRFITHCDQVKKCDIDILQTGWHGNNALHYAMYYNVLILKYLLSDVYFPNNNFFNPKGMKAINQQTSFGGNTPAHDGSCQANYSKIEHFQLLQSYNCDGHLASVDNL